MFVNDNVIIIVLYVLGWNMNKVYAYLDILEVFGVIYYIVCIYVFYILKF